jgi:hypothetical protein
MTVITTVWIIKEIEMVGDWGFHCGHKDWPEL